MPADRGAAPGLAAGRRRCRRYDRHPCRRGGGHVGEREGRGCVPARHLQGLDPRGHRPGLLARLHPAGRRRPGRSLSLRRRDGEAAPLDRRRRGPPVPDVLSPGAASRVLHGRARANRARPRSGASAGTAASICCAAWPGVSSNRSSRPSLAARSSLPTRPTARSACGIVGRAGSGSCSPWPSTPAQATSRWPSAPIAAGWPTRAATRPGCGTPAPVRSSAAGRCPARPRPAQARVTPSRSRPGGAAPLPRGGPRFAAGGDPDPQPAGRRPAQARGGDRGPRRRPRRGRHPRRQALHRRGPGYR